MSQAEDDFIQAEIDRLAAVARAPEPPPVTLPGADVAKIREDLDAAIAALQYAGRSTRVYRDRQRFEGAATGLAATLGRINRTT